MQASTSFSLRRGTNVLDLIRILDACVHVSPLSDIAATASVF